MAHDKRAFYWPELRRFLSINAPADLSFRPPALLRPPLHGSPCAGDRALQGNENPVPSGTFISGNRLSHLKVRVGSLHLNLGINSIN